MKFSSFYSSFLSVIHLSIVLMHYLALTLFSECLLKVNILWGKAENEHIPGLRKRWILFIYIDALYLRHDLPNSTTGSWKNSGRTKLFCRNTLTLLFYLFIFGLIDNALWLSKNKTAFVYPMSLGETATYINLSMKIFSLHITVLTIVLNHSVVFDSLWLHGL